MSARRTQIARSHVNAVRSQFIGSGQYPRVTQSILNSRKLQGPALPPQTQDDALSIQSQRKLVVRLMQTDTFNAAATLKTANPADKVACLNHANANRAGGGFMSGSIAQEEDLCHCSTLYNTLNPNFYPMQSDELIYSPDILILKSRGSAEGTYDLVQGRDANALVYVDVISSAAVAGPELVQVPRVDNDGIAIPGGEDTFARDEDRQLMRDKMRWILNAAAQNGVKRLVVGAYGCGVFRNPVGEIARLWKELLLGDLVGSHTDGPATDWTRYGLVEVVIAIYDPSPQQMVWNSFMKEFRHGGGLHTIGGIPAPQKIQYTAFSPEV